MSRTCAPISTPGGGTAKVRNSKPSAFAGPQGSASAPCRPDCRNRGRRSSCPSGCRPACPWRTRPRQRPATSSSPRSGRCRGSACRRRPRQCRSRARCRGSCLSSRLIERGGLRRAVERLRHRAFLLEALMRLHRGRHLVFVVDLVDLDLVALDAALAVHQRVVVLIAGHSTVPTFCVGPVRSHCVAEQHLLVLGHAPTRRAPTRPPRPPPAPVPFDNVVICSSLCLARA